MTREEYGAAYKNKLRFTVSTLVSKGIRSDVAEETAHAAWAKGWENIDQLHDPADVHKWVNTSALNMFRDSLRRTQYVGEDQLPKQVATPEHIITSIDVKTVLDLCPYETKELLVMFYLRGLSVNEIAKQTGRTATAVRIRLHKARKAAKNFFMASCEKRLSVAHH